MNKNLRIQTTFGILWNGLSQLSTQVFQFIVVIILARLLTPEDFGIVGLTTLFIGLIAIINELGLSAAIIQRKDISEEHISTSFWSNIAFGIIFFILTVLVSSIVADFFNEKLLKNILIVSSIGIIIGSFGIVHKALLEKSLDFKKTTVVEICTAFGTGIVSIVLAVSNYGVWSIIIGNISGNIISVILLWRLNKWRPSLKFSLFHFKELFSFGGNVAGSNIFNYIAMKIDYIIIGKMLGTTSLGYYSLARTITAFPIQKVSWTVTRVVFPAFSSIQDNDNMLKEGYLKVIKYISLVTFPMLAGMFIVAPEFVNTFYGPKWSPMIILLQILAIEGVIVSIGTITGIIQYSKGRSDIQFKLQLLAAITMTIAVLIGSNYGIVGVTIAFTIMASFLAFIAQEMTNKLIDLSMKDYIKQIIPATVGSIMLIVVVYIYKIFTNVDIINTLLISIFLGILIYFILIWKLYNSIFVEIAILIREMIE